jgi:hypothetical protein
MFAMSTPQVPNAALDAAAGVAGPGDAVEDDDSVAGVDDPQATRPSTNIARNSLFMGMMLRSPL